MLKWLGRTLAILVLAIAGGAAGRAFAIAKAPAQVDGPHAFTMSGSLSDLVPGRPATLRVTVVNPNSQDIRLTSIVVTAAHASASCPAGLLTISMYSGTPQYVVAAKNRSTVDLSVVLSSQAPSACRGVSFSLSYKGGADQWH